MDLHLTGATRRVAWRIGRIIGAASALALVVTTWVTPSSAVEVIDDGTYVPAPQWSYETHGAEPVAADVAARAALEGVGLDEAARRYRVEDAASVLESESLARWPDTFGGMWISHDPFDVNVAFTDNSSANVASLAETFPYPDELAAVTVEYSLAELSAGQEAAVDDRAALQDGDAPTGLPAAISRTGGDFDIDIDVARNAVVLRSTRATAALGRAAKARYGAMARVRPGRARPALCTQTDCRNAMVGGIKLTIPGYGYCSAAFTVASGATRYMLSAGHCWGQSHVQDRLNAGSTLGYVDRYKWADNVDAERSVRASPWRATSKFYVEGENPRFVRGWRTYGDQTVGALISKTGATSGTTAGYIESKTFSPSYVPNGYNFLTADFCVSSGDSGGSVWRGTTAWGIVSGNFPGTSCRGGGQGKGIYGAIGPAMNALNVDLLGGDLNLSPTASWTHACTLLGSCTFDGTASDDEDGSITSYRWTFSNGTTASGAVVTRSLLPGSYTVTLTVTDNNGATHSLSKPVLVL